MSRHYLNVPYKEKDQAKALGARFDWDRKSWYIPEGQDSSPFQRWLPQGVATFEPLQPAAIQPVSENNKISTERNQDRSENTAVGEVKGIALSQLLNQVGNAVHALYPAPVWTLVEITEAHLRHHVYLEVSERNAQGQPVAKARAMIWANTASRILPEFEQATGVVISAGIKLLVLARPVFHIQYGLSLQIEAIDAQYVLGYLEAQRRKIRERLKKEGVFENNRQLPAPWDFYRVLVVAPFEAAGLGDFQKEAMRLEQYEVCQFVYASSRFQGMGAAQEIVTALDSALSRLGDNKPDAVVIVRGGGAVSDLAWLDDYDLVRYVCDMTIPVFTGIGHERDTVLLDEVAHTRFDTPSKVILGIEQRIQTKVAQTQQAMQIITRYSQQLINRLHNKTEAQYRAICSDARQHLALAKQQLPLRFKEVSFRAEAVINNQRNQVHSNVQLVTEQSHLLCLRATSQVYINTQRVFERAMGAIKLASNESQSLMREIIGQGPDKTLARGFAIIYDSTDKPVMNKTQAYKHNILKIQFSDGQIQVRQDDK